MSDHEQISKLTERLQHLNDRRVTHWERPIVDVQKSALEAEIETIGERLRRQGYWRPSMRRVESAA